MCESSRLSFSLSTALISCGGKLHLALSLSRSHSLPMSLSLFSSSLSLSLSLTSHSHMTARNIPSFAGARFQHPTPSDKHAQAYTQRQRLHTHMRGTCMHTCAQAPDQWLPQSLVCQMTASVHMLIHGERHAEDCNHPGETCLPVVSASDCPQKQTNYIIKFTTVTS